MWARPWPCRTGTISRLPIDPWAGQWEAFGAWPSTAEAYGVGKGWDKGWGKGWSPQGGGGGKPSYNFEAGTKGGWEKGKGKGFQGECWNCGEKEHSAKNCRKEKGKAKETEEKEDGS